jgi:hypothetical protein
MTSPQNVLVWPTLDEYDNALKNVTSTVYDPDVKDGKLSFDSRPLRLNGKGGKYVAVYKVGEWVVKCFITNATTTGKLVSEPPPDIRDRYHEINNYLRGHIGQLSFLVPQIWIEKGININGHGWPIIKSAFMNPVQTLGQFLADRHTDSTTVRALSKQWLTLIKTLESLNIAHGDLDVTNVLVYGSFPAVKLHLVDFDSMYVPTMQGRMLYEQGHEHFQPVQAGIRQFNNEMDRFSALVIYLSLIALAEDPHLWDQCKANEDAKLLLGQGNFRNLRDSTAYQLLRAKRSNQAIQKCLVELELSMQEVRMPKSLSNILDGTSIPSTHLQPIEPVSYYEGTFIPIPLGALPPNPPPLEPASPPPPLEQLDIPFTIPLEFLQSTVSDSSQSSIGSSSGQQQQFSTPSPQSSTKVHPFVWLLLVAAGVTLILSIGYSYLFVVTICLGILALVVWRSTRQ